MKLEILNQTLLFLLGLVFGAVLCWISLFSPLVMQPISVMKQQEFGPISKLSDSGTIMEQPDTKPAELGSKDLYSSVRVLCWVMTSKDNLLTRAVHVNATWGKRCNKILYASDIYDESFPTIDIKVQPGRSHLTSRTMKTFDYIYRNHLDDADWFLKADDDTFVVPENLRYFLQPFSPDSPVFFGHHFRTHVKQGYFSGGAGYVLSKEALGRFGKRDPKLCREDNGDEDVEMGKCMESLGIVTGDSRDKLNRSRFHCFRLEHHLEGNYLNWYLEYDQYGAQKGPESISDLPITFHYVKPEDMYIYDIFTYRIRAYGINMQENLNRDDLDYSYAKVVPHGGSHLRDSSID